MHKVENNTLMNIEHAEHAYLSDLNKSDPIARQVIEN